MSFKNNQSIGTGQIVPFLSDIISYCDTLIAENKKVSKEDVTDFIRSHCNDCIIFEIKVMYGENYCIVKDLKKNKNLTLPCSVVLVKEGNAELFDNCETEFDINNKHWKGYLNLINSYIKNN